MVGEGVPWSIPYAKACGMFPQELDNNTELSGSQSCRDVHCIGPGGAAQADEPSLPDQNVKPPIHSRPHFIESATLPHTI